MADMTQKEIPTPRITARPDGHFAVCPDCGQEFEVSVENIDHPDPADHGGSFVTRREVTATGLSGRALERITAQTVEHKLTSYENHYRQDH